MWISVEVGDKVVLGSWVVVKSVVAGSLVLEAEVVSFNASKS